MLLSESHGILASAFIVYYTSVFSRRCLSFAAPAMKATGIVSDSDLGAISSSNALSYSVSKTITWVLTDYVSLNSLLFAALLMNAFNMYMFTLCISVECFSMWQLFAGLFHGMCWPICGKLVKMNVPKSTFGTWWGIISSATNVASASGPFLTMLLVSANPLWFRIFYFSSSASMLAVLLFGFAMNRAKQDSVSGSSSESASSNEASPTNRTSNEEKGSYLDVILNPLVVSVSLSYIFLGCVRYALGQWLLLYLNERFNNDTSLSMYCLSIMEIGGFVGALSSGPVSDLLTRCGWTRSSVRLLLTSNAALAVALFVFVYSNITQSILIVCMCTLLGYLSYTSYSLYGMSALTLLDKAGIQGMVAAVVDLCGSMGTFLSGSR